MIVLLVKLVSDFDNLLGFQGDWSVIISEISAGHIEVEKLISYREPSANYV